MAFHIDTYHLPRIYGYDDAKNRFNNLTPIRGGDQSVRRIGKRNDATKWLKHEIRDGVDVYVVGLHRTDVITYYPTHYEIFMGGWGTTSTMLFITAITGRLCTGISTRNYVPQGFPESLMGAAHSYNGYPINTRTTYKFDYDDNPLDLDAHPKLVKYKVNRKRMNEVRRVAKPFYDYVNAMNNLTDRNISDDGRNDYWSSPYRNGEKLLADISNQDKWWEMFQCLAWQTQNRRFDYQLGHMVYERNTSNMKRKIENELKYNSPHVLDAV
jgi:hypothetical protein